METLTELGRHQKCKAIGIRNPNSIFVKSKEAFLDRMNLYRLVYNIDELVNAYKTELKEHVSEEEFIAKIEKDTRTIYDVVEKEIVKAEMLDTIFGSGSLAKALNATTEYNVFLRDETNECTLRIYFESPVYEAFKFLTLGIYSCHSTFSDFVYDLTDNKFLAATKDLDLMELSIPDYRNTLIAQMNLISSVLADIICPKYINRKHVKSLKGAEMLISSTVNKTVDSLDKIASEIANADGCSFENVCIELFTVKSLAVNNCISLKKCIVPNEISSKLNIIKSDEYTFVKYLRKIRDEQESKYDNILANGDMEMQVTQDIKIAWV